MGSIVYLKLFAESVKLLYDFLLLAAITRLVLSLKIIAKFARSDTKTENLIMSNLSSQII